MPVLLLVDALPPLGGAPAGTPAPGVTTATTAPDDDARIRAVDPAAPHVTVLDLGVTRGDGIFESFGVVEGAVQALEPHLVRLARSATLLDLPALDLDVLRTAVLRSVELHEPLPELLCKLVVTRGVEGATDAHGRPAVTAWVYTDPGADFRRERTEGVDVVTLDRGYRHDVAQTSPWLLQGAKTLSYAVNKAVYREAARRGAQDVVLVSSDGFVLEGPTSTLVARYGDRVVTPATDQGILAGTTQAAAFAWFAAQGLTTAEVQLTVERLREADGLWLLSSGRQSVPIRSLDGTSVPVDDTTTAGLLTHLLGRRS
ncbi:4-amino-4-deoxychorismate lyase [Cellulomonas marina]|uniref:4-amino-4-deoxychorismate lyase n=1 Tax=Cellulomonas marina TaxID=988821 RepID=A0A1I0Z752_9CELL|nr:4-amino-4-deoxychorismate lyase [Cellulomonas marina]SFB20083.1 4-amino-4-deoxychorismate lyase [Cellulomonas marina]